jgi:porin
MRIFTMRALAMFLFIFSLAANARTEEPPNPNPYSGDIWTRSTLTGDWWGLRNDLAAKGITLDVSLTQATQGIVSGGKDQVWLYGGGRGDIILNVDSQKLGLWPGGFLGFEAEGNFTPEDNFLKTVNGKTGALMPVNSSQLDPMPSGDNFNVPALHFSQFLSHYFGLTFGKYATLTANSGDMNEFAHGKGDTQFMNLALNANPTLLLTVPYSTLGTGAIFLPTQDPKQAVVSFMLLQTNGQASTSGFEHLDANKLTFSTEGRLRTDFFGLTGHQLFGTTFSNKKYTSLDQRISLEDNTVEAKKGSWSVHYNFDQYLYEPEKGSGRGVGVFGRFGASDGNPNPMRFFGSLGIGGKGAFASRPNDRFGVGYYYIDIRSPKFTGPLASREFLRDEYGFEFFYNIAITPWMMLTPDVQVIRPSQKQKLNPGPRPPLTITTKDVNTVTVLGLRLQVVF